MTDEQLLELAHTANGQFVRRTRTMEDFRYDEQQEKYWDVTTGNLLGAKSVDGAIPRDEWPTTVDGRSGEDKPQAPSRAINDVDTGLTVEGSTWWPGQPQFIRNVVVGERGAMRMEGAVCYNSYLPPHRKSPPEGCTADPWIDHVRTLYPTESEQEHFFDYAAHMIQRPDEKINHGIVLAGGQGIGKDTALMPLRRGVGEWNAAEINPDAVHSQYNPYVRAVLLVVNEVRPHDEDHRASNFYNMLKPLLAAPPEMLPMTLKYANTIYVRNLVHVFLTTNDPLTMYIPPEDRRLFVMSSPYTTAEGSGLDRKYFEGMYSWMAGGGADAVIDWLAKRDILTLNPGGPPPMTAGKQAIIDSAHQVRRTFVDEIFEEYSENIFSGERPKVVFHRDLIDFVRHANLFDDERKVIAALNAKNFHYKMAERGYDMVRCPYATEWKRGKFRTRMAFCDKAVPVGEQVAAIESELQRRPWE